MDAFVSLKMIVLATLATLYLISIVAITVKHEKTQKILRHIIPWAMFAATITVFVAGFVRYGANAFQLFLCLFFLLGLLASLPWLDYFPSLRFQPASKNASLGRIRFDFWFCLIFGLCLVWETVQLTLGFVSNKAYFIENKAYGIDSLYWAWMIVSFSMVRLLNYRNYRNENSTIKH